jgi:hypothetical protein
LTAIYQNKIYIMTKKTFLFGVALSISALIVASCAQVYTSPEAAKLVNKHKIIAIVPPKVTIAARKKVDVEAIKQQQKLESENIQKEIYNWLLRRKGQEKMFVEILDVETTNAKLKKAGYFDDAILTPAEIAEVTDVDAVIISNFSLSKPMSEGGAIALGLLFGVWGPTNETYVSMEMHDRITKKLFWNYNHDVSGSVGSTPAQLVNALMRNASRKMPYFVRNR